jgi:hypothetical protein
MVAGRPKTPRANAFVDLSLERNTNGPLECHPRLRAASSSGVGLVVHGPRFHIGAPHHVRRLYLVFEEGHCLCPLAA